MYGQPKSRVSNISMTVSIILHITAFLIFAFVKFLPDKEIRAVGFGVEFVNLNKTRLMKRSLPVRAPASLDESTQKRPTGQKVDTRINHGNFSDFYVSDSPQRVFSEIKSVKSAVANSSSLRRPTANFGKDIAQPVAIELRQSNTPRVQTGISGGNELFNTKSAAGLKKPEIEMIRDGKNVLQEFIDSVRKDIESKKKYPSVARDAGFEGRSGVKMVILKNGDLAEVVLVDSSGHEILDNAALQSVRDAAPFSPIPKQVGRDRIEMNIYIVFKIT